MSNPKVRKPNAESKAKAHAAKAESAPARGQVTTATAGAGTAALTARRARPSKRGGEGSGMFDKYIAGVPARFMRPRLIFIACLAAIVSFGLLMVYSASSAEALKEFGSSTRFLGRQAIFVGLGLVCLASIVCTPASVFENKRLIRLVTYLLELVLLLVLVIGYVGGGAKRWIAIGFFSFQPSEFAKPVFILMTSTLFSELYEERSITTLSFALQLALTAGLSCLLIIAEPDMGTTSIIIATLFLMALYAGVSHKTAMGMGAFIVLLVVAGMVAASYRWSRVQAWLDPWADQYGTAMQICVAIMAFASGGIFGRGIGNSTMKYSYLPEAHNDYILAVIGEELGFVGTLVFIGVYLLMLVAAFRIAERAPSKFWGLVAAGSSTILMVQFFINALGILKGIPMTGKPLPFVSYGGSSMISSMILAGLIIRTSIESNRRSIHDAARESFRVVDESTAGEPRVRSRSGSGFSVLEGGAGSGSNAPARPHRRNSTLADARPGASRSGGYDRIDLNADPTARLRSGGVRRTGGTSTENRYGGGPYGR